MERYDRVMNDIRRKTEEEDIHWKVVNGNHYSDVLLNSDRVIRAFYADYPMGGKTYKLLFSDRKFESQDDDFPFDNLALSLLVLDEDRQIVLNLYDGLVNRDELLRLSGLIEAHNDRTNQFFEAFDQYGVA